MAIFLRITEKLSREWEEYTVSNYGIIEGNLLPIVECYKCQWDYDNVEIEREWILITDGNKQELFSGYDEAILEEICMSSTGGISNLSDIFNFTECRFDLDLDSICTHALVRGIKV
jgi:hypothetical protein